MISLYLLSLLMISIFNYRYYECYCTLCYMYLQVIRINIIIIIIYVNNKPGVNSYRKLQLGVRMASCQNALLTLPWNTTLTVQESSLTPKCFTVYFNGKIVVSIRSI